MLDSPTGFTWRMAVKFTAIFTLILLGCGLVLGFGLGMVIGFCTAMHRPTPGWADPHHPGFMVIVNTAAAGLALWYGLHKTGSTWRQLVRSHSPSPKIYAALLVAFTGFVTVYSEVSNVAQWLVPPPEFIRKFFGNLSDLSAHPLAAPMALLVVAPLTEELFFRGLVLRRLLATSATRPAIWTSSLVFMAFHINPWQFPIALLTGLLLGWVYARSRSLPLCILGHAFVNATSLLATGLPFTITGFNTPHPDQLVFQPWWFDAAGLVLLGAGIYLLNRITPVVAPAATVSAASRLIPETA